MDKKINLKVALTILVVSLGYFVDIFDLILFSVVRVQSLRELGLTEIEILDKGILLLNIQMMGMLLGGIFFGIYADKKGRLSVLLSSILLYSMATLLNAYVQSIEAYAVLRFLAGFGLAGELGVGVTLVSELLPQNKRSYGIATIATIGMCGALIAWPVAKAFDWRTAYMIGGGMGLALLALRVGLLESDLFLKSHKMAETRRGQFLALFSDKKTFLKFLACVLVGIQLWFIMGIMIALSPEFATQLSISENIVAGESIFYLYIGVISGGFLSSITSQLLKSRIKTLILFMTFSSAGIVSYFFLRNISNNLFYAFCVFLGLSGGYWAIFVQLSAEQFGTNLRATATTTITNFGRATLIPISILFASLKGQYGLFNAGLTVGVICIALSIWPLFYLKETFYKDLDYVE